MTVSISKNHIVRINGDVITLDRVELPSPPNFNGHNTNLTTTDNHIYLNGYEWKNNKWRRTLKAVWHYIF